MQGRFAARRDRDFRLKEKIEFAGEGRFDPARAFGHGLNATQRLGAPGDDQAGVAKLSFAKQDRCRGLHDQNVARDYPLLNRRFAQRPFLVEGIEMRDHDVHLEHHLVAGEANI